MPSYVLRAVEKFSLPGVCVRGTVAKRDHSLACGVYHNHMGWSIYLPLGFTVYITWYTYAWLDWPSGYRYRTRTQPKRHNAALTID